MRRARLVTAIAAALVATPSAFAQFAPGPNPITGTVGVQTLATGTGTVDAGGAINVASGSGVPLTITGSATLINNGTIQTAGSGRTIDSAAAGATIAVTNNGLISSVSTDAFRINADAAVSLINSGTIRVTAGGQAIDWAAITTRSNQLTNDTTGVISAVGEDAVRPGTNGVVVNSGTISATVTGAASPSGSDGIDVRTFTGISVTNSGLITGRHGIATDGANAGPSSITVDNQAGGTIAAVNGSGLNIDGPSATVQAFVTNAAGATFRGGVRVGATTADGDGIDVDGVLNLVNSGDVLGLGAKGAGNNAEGIAAGGGQILNTATGRIVGSTLAADAPNGDPTRAGNGILIDNSSGGAAVAQTTVTNSGLIQGKSGFGIRIVGNLNDVVQNFAGGTIQGAGPEAAIQTGGGNDALTNSGAIVSDGNAVDLGDGDDSISLQGGAVSIVGDVSGGTGVNVVNISLGGGNDFAYAGVLSNFDSVNLSSGNVALSGANTYTGTTYIHTGTLTLDGANRLSAASSLVLQTNSTLQLVNAGGANGQTFSNIGIGIDATLDLGQSSVTFGSLLGFGPSSTFTVLDWSDTTSPAFAFRFFGDQTANADFLALVGATTINGFGAAFSFDGGYTNVLPTPLPAGVWLLFSGLGMLGAVARSSRSTTALLA
jgi:autotransporter-associated beta strand protein